MTFSRIVPYLTAFVPEALVAAIPQRDASAPGSVIEAVTIEKKQAYFILVQYSTTLVTEGRLIVITQSLQKQTVVSLY